jgi:uncharacterized protein (DUF2141 family)
MRLAALLLVGIATASSASAQTNPARVTFLPMPDTLPALLFAPDPLSGTMLKPLSLRAPDANNFAEVPPEPAVIAVAATAAPLVEDPPVDPPPLAGAPKQAPEANAYTEDAPADPGEPAADAPTAPVEAAPATPPPAEAPPAAANSKETTVTVIVENVESSSGNVNVAVCDKDLSREGCPYVHEVKAQQGFVETEFRDIPPGNYAVVGYHDVNGNNQFDKLMGIPREPYALSGAASEKLVPTFTDAELPIKSGENAVIIRLKRLGG